MRESALIVAVPEAEPVVGRHRRDLDHSAQWGVPAHVTVLYPFASPARIDGDTIEAVRAVISAEAFDCVLARPQR
ncbi:MAG TPA: hypothetical protein VGR06_32930 [Actinophytocola sp.]|jgi:hypothetical protein|uniref:hypothetical protein n=1 Tax=Actinophytocola sp. TaxID=1872138 RepID=UPI002DFF49A1|nr:hypothetical protein [Actinophytocola sp.]